MPGSATIAAVNAREARPVRPKAASAATPGNAFSHRPHASGGRPGWPLIRFERREAEPGCRDMPRGAPEHLVLVGMGGGALTRQIGSERVRLDLKPGFVTVLLFSFVAAWNNFFLPLLVLSRADLFPVTVGLANWYALATQPGNVQTLYAIVVTGSIVAILPVMVLFLFLQRYWQQGLSLGSVRG